MTQVQPCRALHHTGFQIRLTGVASVGALFKLWAEKDDFFSKLTAITWQFRRGNDCNLSILNGNSCCSWRCTTLERSLNTFTVTFTKCYVVFTWFRGWGQSQFCCCFPSFSNDMLFLILNDPTETFADHTCSQQSTALHVHNLFLAAALSELM